MVRMVHVRPKVLSSPPRSYPDMDHTLPIAHVTCSDGTSLGFVDRETYFCSLGQNLVLRSPYRRMRGVCGGAADVCF
jgi:hypothetical protein